MASMSVSGVVSGMDWDSMIDEIITNAAKPAQVKVARKTNLTNKKSLFEEMKVTMNSLQSSLSPLKLPSTYKAKTIDIERLDSTKSYKGVLTATVNADAEVNVWDVEVKQLASAQTNRSKQITASNLNSTLSGVTGSTMYINAGGQKIGVEVKSSDTLESLKSRINTTLKTLDNPIHVTASVVDNKLILKSDYTGLGAFTANETINYSSNGVNTITGFSVSDDTRENVKITNGSTTYTYGTDYVIVNGNEIRWKKYDQSKEVALDDTVTVKYNMAAGDKYEKNGTYGTNEADISRLSMIDNGTLSSRLKITDDNNVTYTYGKDFTLDSSGKVVWLEESEATTNEPDSYTVNYNKTVQDSTSASGTKEGGKTPPTSYIVSYKKQLLAPVSVTKDANMQQTIASPEYSSLTSLDGLTSTYSSTTQASYIVPDDATEITLTDGNTEYVYGQDFILRSSFRPTTLGTIVSWNGDPATKAPGVNYIDDYASGTVSRVNTLPATGTELQLSYTHAYTSQNKLSADVLSAAGSDYENIIITDTDGNEYKFGEDFTIVGSQIQWYNEGPSVDDDIAPSDFADLKAKYNTYAGNDSDADLPTVTLLDADGVVRTYFDPEDRSMFTLTATDAETGDTISYEYGRDYVIRVNDSGNGYVVSWAVTGDKNKDLSVDIKDANTEVTTYTAAKGISTSGWQAAPSADSSYTLDFTYDKTITASGTVSSSTTKSLASVLGVSIDSSDYATTLTITDGTNTYAYGTDWTIDSSGNIKWLDTSSPIGAGYTAQYTFGSSSFTSATMTAAQVSSGGTTYTRVTSGTPFSGLGLETVTSGAWQYVTEEYGKAAFSLTLDDGTVMEYGKDFAVRGSGNVIDVVYPNNSSWPFSDTKDGTATKPTTGFTLTFNNPLTISSSDSGADISDILGFTPSDYSKLTITDKNGATYTYSASDASDLGNIEFTLVNGVVTLKSNAPKHPGDGVGYTLTYEAFSAITAAGTTDGSTPQEVSITIDSGYGNYDGNKRSYEQILSDTGLTSSSSSEDWAKYFTLTSGTTTYTYGTDYTIIQGSDTDSSTGEHNVMINWLNAPASGADFTLSYGGNGGEVLTTDGVTRSATDSVIGSPLATAFDGGTNTITYGSKTYYEGIDFDIDPDSSGYATVTWISDDYGGYEWYYPTSNSYYTINHIDDDGNTTTYNASRTGSATLNISEMKTANGSISVEYGGGLSYKLNAPDITYDDGTSATIAEAIKSAYGISITPTTGSSYTFNWVAPTLTSRTNLPAYGTELTVEYEYDANTFDLSDDGDGDLLYALGFTKSDGSYDDYTAAKNAILVIDGEQEVERDSNDIGESYENELIKGVTMHLKGLGEVSLDISHDAEKAVESIQTFVDNYNDLMTWMNTRMTEKQLDEDTAATVDSDDFRMRWGLLHGNSLLRQTKSQMRSLTSQNFTFSFTQRKSSEEIYGTMGFNGLKSSSTLRLRIGTKYVDVTIDPTDTLETIVAKISDDTKNGAMHNIYYDDDGNKLQSPLLKAYVENDKLVIQSSSNDEITMSGSAAMNALKMNYTYKGLYQIGIESTSDDYGKSGELVFDANEFMEALEENPDEVQALMMKFVTQFDTWTKSMLNSSSSGQTSGTLTREIENIQSQIDSINEYLETYQERLDRMEENLRTRYGNTETQFARLSQQASSIAAILNQLNGTASGGGYGQTSS